MYVCMYVCIYACMHVCMYACMDVWMYGGTYVRTCVRTYVRMYSYGMVWHGMVWYVRMYMCVIFNYHTHQQHHSIRTTELPHVYHHSLQRCGSSLTALQGLRKDVSMTGCLMMLDTNGNETRTKAMSSPVARTRVWSLV